MKLRDRIKSFRRVKASDLAPDPRNWRAHPQAQQDALRGVLAEVGIADAVLARELPDGTLMLVDGHLRADVMPDQKIPCLILDVDEAEAAKLLATLDPLAKMAEADPAKLDELLREVQTSSQAVEDMLAELAEDAGILEDSPEIVEDDVPEPPADPITKPGDLWTLGEHRVLCGDSTKGEDVERVMGGEKAAMVFTDPPYGIDIQEGDMQQAAVRGRRKDGKGVENDNLTGDALRGFLDSVFKNVFDASSPGACWYVCAPPGVDYRHPLNSLEEIGVARHGIVWVKDRFVMGRCDYHYRHENIIYGWTPGAAHHPVPSRNQDTVWELTRPGSSPEHPTMKPVGLVAKAVENSTDEAQTILDPFLGSGTTLIACEQLNRRCFGIEISPAYCDVVVARWEKLTGQKAARE